MIPLLALGLAAIAWTSGRLGAPAAPPPLPGMVEEVPLQPLPSPAVGVTVRGTVRSARGTAVAQALVLGRAGDAPVWDHTNERGEFELSGLRPGRALLRVLALRFEVEDFLVDAPADGLRLLLTNELGPPPSLPPIEVETLVGEVAAPSPEWVGTGYEVLLLPTEPSEALGAPVPRRAVVRSDRGFRFDDLVLGRYEVVVLPPWARGGFWPSLTAPAARELVHARAGVTPRAVLALAAGSLELDVRDAAGAALEDALVLIHPEGRPAHLWPPRATDAGGMALVRDLPPGSYRVRVSSGRTELARVLDVQAGRTLRLELQLDEQAR